MGFPGLNLPQQVAAPAGAVGGVVGPNPTAINRTPKSAQIVQGISQLMQGFMAAKTGAEQHYGQKVDDIASQLAAGNITPDSVDFNKVASWMKKSNRGYNTDQTPAQAQQLQAMMTQNQFQQTLGQAQQGAQAMASQASGMPAQAPGPMGSPGQPGVAAPGVTPPSPAPQAVPPGFMDRIRMALGKGPNPSGANWSDTSAPSAMSPAAQSIRNLGVAAQTGGGMPGQIQRSLQGSVLESNIKRAMGTLDQKHAEAMLPVYTSIFGKALQGDPESNKILRNLKVFEGTPSDEIAHAYQEVDPSAPITKINAETGRLLLWQQGGGPALQLKIADLGKDMIPRFGGDAGKAMSYVNGLYSGNDTGLKPSLTPKEFDEQTSATSRVVERYPSAPVGLANMYGTAVMSGQKDLASNVLDYMSSHYKTASDIQQGQFGATLGQSESQFRRGQSQSESQFQRKVVQDYAQIASQHDVGSREADNGQIRYINDAIETMLKATNSNETMKTGTQGQKDAVAARVNDLVNSLAGTTVNINGKAQQLAPFQALTDRNNVQNPWKNMIPGVPSQGPNVQGHMLPSFGPVPSAPKSGLGQQLINQAPSAALSTQPNPLQQMLLQRATGQ